MTAYLTDAEFDLLTDEEQDLYLRILQAELESWSLNPRQGEADTLADRCTELLYGGAAGGGKSEWMLHRAHRLSMQYPGHSTLMLRSSFPELRRSLIRRSIERIPAGEARWRAGDKEWRYNNGSVIEFGYAETDDDVGQYLSAEYDLICFDELTEFTAYQYEMIRSRLRTTRAKRNLGVRPHVIAATNPGRRGHQWVKDLFVVNTDYGRKVIDEVVRHPVTDEPVVGVDGDPIRRVIGFVHATVLDNPHIDPGYVANLLSLPETLRRQYLEGDWDVFEGMFFPEFSRATHVIEPFEIPHEWPRFRAVDYGYAAPWCCLWFARSPDGQIIVYRERYQARVRPTEQAEIIKASSVCSAGGVTRAERIDFTKGDPAMWASTRGEVSIALTYAQLGVPMQKANNDRIPGWGRIRDYLALDDDGMPGVVIFSTCPNLIRTLADMRHHKDRPEDLDTKSDDHAVDTMRYGLMSRPRDFPKGRRERAADLNERVRRRLEDFAKRRRGVVHPELGRLA